MLDRGPAPLDPQRDPDPAGPTETPKVTNGVEVLASTVPENLLDPAIKRSPPLGGEDPWTGGGAWGGGEDQGQGDRLTGRRGRGAPAS